MKNTSLLLSQKLSYKDSMTYSQRFLKRSFDIFLSGIGLILASPLYLLICLLYICTQFKDKGPIIYCQIRIGYKGKPFYIYKFRTMKKDAEKYGTPQLAEKNDPRLTKLGRFLRAHHLDELPQLWNVFIGDMSFVGPRPERKFFIDQIMQEDDRYSFLYSIRPGLTSPATLYNGYTDSMQKMLWRLQMDLDYMENRNLMLDIKIIYKTIKCIVLGKCI